MNTEPRASGLLENMPEVEAYVGDYSGGVPDALVQVMAKKRTLKNVPEVPLR